VDLAEKDVLVGLVPVLCFEWRTADQKLVRQNSKAKRE
jgi:phosphoribulokinase